MGTVELNNLVIWYGNVMNNMFVSYYENIVGTNISDPHNKRYPLEINLMLNDVILVQHIIEYFNDSVDDQWNLLHPVSIQNCSAAPV